MIKGGSMEKDIAKREETQVVEASPMALAQSFLSGGGDVASLEKMLELQATYDAMQAKKAYVAAMANFKSNPPEIVKDKKVSFQHKNDPGRTEYSHASLGNVTKTINKSLGENGLSAAWDLEQIESRIKVTCIVTHELGHSESTYLTAALDQSGKKNNIQAAGSTISYLQRYTLLAITGLATQDQDDDGQSAEDVKLVDEKQVSQLTDMINSIDNFSLESFLAWAKIENLEDMPVCDFGKAMNALRTKKENVNKKD